MGAGVNAWAVKTALTGEAQLSYVKYDESADGKDSFSGSTFAQKYSIAYYATNLLYKSQPRYFSLKIGYDWSSFNTKTDGLVDRNLKQSYGNLRYSGAIGYNASELPIVFSAYINQDHPLYFQSGLMPYALVDDHLIYNIQGRGTSIASGFNFSFEPSRARNFQLAGLPRMLVSYRDIANKNDEAYYKVDNRYRELAVAALNQESNWIIYRAKKYENHLDPLDRYTEQQFQIGLVDNRGRRLWAALTNWIDASADGLLTIHDGQTAGSKSEEYDLNFMAIATRKTWNARTFMNFNRFYVGNGFEETAKVPIYLRGTYGTDTSWYTSVSESYGKQVKSGTGNDDKSYSHSLNMGFTTFQRASFTLSPSLTIQSGKSYMGNSNYSIEAHVETASTRRFSEKLGLSGFVFAKVSDDGSSAHGSDWRSGIQGSAVYQADSRFTYRLTDRFEMGRGSFDATRQASRTPGTVVGADNMRNTLSADGSWMITERLRTGLTVSFDTIKQAGLPLNNEIDAVYSIGYSNKATSYRLNTRYKRTDPGVGPASISWLTTAEVHYRPDRYNDGLLRIRNDINKVSNVDSNVLEILQQYNYNFYTKSGNIRKFLILSEEFVLSGNQLLDGAKKSLLLSARYSPTERLTLYGSGKIEKGVYSDTTLSYSTGLNADFKLVSTNLDYTYARRDIDKRIEKRLAASVRRAF